MRSVADEVGLRAVPWWWSLWALDESGLPLSVMGDALECAQTMSRAVTLTVAQAELLVKDDMRELSLRGANDDATQT